MSLSVHLRVGLFPAVCLQGEYKHGLSGSGCIIKNIL